MTETRKGELYIAGEALLWGLFPVITVLSYRGISGFIALAWSSLFAGFLFGFLVAYKNLWHEMRNRTFWKYIAGVTLFIGVLFYAFYFVGLEYTTPGNAAIAMVFQVVAAYVFFNLIRRESFVPRHLLGAALGAIAALIVLAEGFTGLDFGIVLVLIGASIAPIGNMFQRKAREIASSETIMFVRSIAAAIIMFTVSTLVGTSAAWADVQASLPFLLINGVLVLGVSKIFWLEAIHRLPVPTCNAVENASPFVTLLAAWALLGQRPDMWQLLALVPMLLGVLLLTDRIRFQRAVA